MPSTMDHFSKEISFISRFEDQRCASSIQANLCNLQTIVKDFGIKQEIIF